MAYTGLTIQTTIQSADSSHTIPAYPEYNSSTTFDSAFYTDRQTSNNVLAGGIITYDIKPL